jgi:dipeptidyl aminopeptidase/acylaminoacyl peptidase
LYQVSKDDSPFLILHGDQDPQVPLDQSQRLQARLRDVGVAAELHVIPGAGHGGKAFDTPEVRKKIGDYLQRTLNPSR